MKTTKFKTFGIAILFGIIGVISAVMINSNSVDSAQETFNGLPVNNCSAFLGYDTSTPEKTIGCSDYAFVAKVNKVLRTEYTHIAPTKTKTLSTPYTIYEIEVVENIKGELDTSKPIELKQFGGLEENGKSYTFIEGGSLLNEGEYYIIMACTWADKNGEDIETSNPDTIVPLGTDYNPLARNSTVSQYKLAYENEEIPEILKNEEKALSKYDVNYTEK